MKKNIRLNPECISCLIKKQIGNYPDGASRSDKIEYMKKIMRLIADASEYVSAPEIMDDVYRIQDEMFGCKKDYSDIKSYFNKLMLSMLPALKKKVDRSEDMLKTAVKIVMAGNYIDFGAMNNVDENKLLSLIESADKTEIDEKQYIQFKNDIVSSENLVYLTDNCGEIVLDKLLMTVIKNINPDIKITAVVRGEPVLNDATVSDANEIGLDEVAEVTGNGDSVGGTCLERISEEAMSIIKNADMIISKGQGNFETLNRCGMNVYYIFMCKCDMFAKRFNVDLYSGMLINDRTVSDILDNM